MKNFRILISIFSVLIILLILIFTSGCMKLLNLQVPDGIYIVGEWNDWTPTEDFKMTFSDTENCYIFELPIASITFKPSRSGNEYSIAWYKVVYKESGITKVSGGVPIWKENVQENENKVTIYASPTLIKNGQPYGVGDSEKFSVKESKWYVGGEFNNWNLQNGEMIWDSEKKVFKFTLTNFNAAQKSYKFKITRNVGDWKPWEFNYDGTKYDAGFDNATLSLGNTGIVDIEITFDPKKSIIGQKVEYK
ncbi:MAG: hypothetical protein ACK4MM_02210 [Fervidobacterium sp.]